MTAEQLLQEIKALTAKKQIFSAKGISIDTLLLALRISETELMPMVAQLQEQGAIILRKAPSIQTQRSRLLGTIVLADSTDSIENPPVSESHKKRPTM
jgi:hypothetical protein